MRNDLTTMRRLLAAWDGTVDVAVTGAGAAVELPGAVPVPVEAATDDVDYAATLGSRHSTLQYAPRPVATGTVLALGRAALQRDSAAWQQDERTGPLELMVFAQRSSDLPRGVYRVHRDGCERIADDRRFTDLEELGGQREFATAAGIATVYAPLARGDVSAGAHGYRLLTTRGAALLYDLNFTMQAGGLVGTIFGGFIPAAARHLTRADGVTRHPVLSTTYALPAEAAQDAQSAQ
ncbi:hypothetical protein GCM10011519_29770 [Marmoricola endophyticus]|uniref:Uncharacterized protein n=1 Tax=Marmoricola endophyticus TaxID=2040280 RepID=A0A917BR87_9ACTN|nr:tpaF [Marmoricola endophyticus]GGF53916.1 hypothetical protein GCM10011519_29770 [Marmoricola endophyticus]